MLEILQEMRSALLTAKLALIKSEDQNAIMAGVPTIDAALALSASTESLSHLLRAPK